MTSRCASAMCFAILAPVVGVTACVAPRDDSAYPSYPVPPLLFSQEALDAKSAAYNARYDEFELQDTNGDGGLNREEWVNYQNYYFTLFDADADSHISWPEHFEAHCGRLRRNAARARNLNPAEIAEGMATVCVNLARITFRDRDRNADGRISIDQEMRAFHEDRFGDLDICRDGLLVPFESVGRARSISDRLGSDVCETIARLNEEYGDGPV